MQSYLTTAFALITAAAGWFYLFYSRAAHNLSAVEHAAANRFRVGLRRAGGVCMIALGILFFVGFNTVSADESPNAFVTTWFAVLLLLGTIVVLALIDVRMTMQFRKRRENEASRQGIDE